jgi:hypothetical protein
MITPSYAPTATERVLPRMALDFTTGVLDSRVTIARLLNTATRVNSSGFIEVVNANLPRFDYDSVTLAAKGLLIEESRTNLFLQSQAFTQSPWSNVGVGTVVDNAATGPDNTLSATVLTPTAGGGVLLNQTVTVALVAHTFSFYAKPNGITDVSLASRDNPNLGLAAFNLLTGVATVQAGATSASMTMGPNGFWRCVVTFTPTLAAANRYRISTSAGDSVKSVQIYGAQLEAGAFATSYIPTTTTSLTRNADYVTMTGTNFSDWYNQSEGAFQIEASATIPASGSQTFIAVSDNTPNNYIGPYMLNVLGYVYHKIVTLGVSQCEFAAAVGVTNNSIFKYAFCYKLNSAQIAVNTVLGAGDTSVSVPTVTLAEIGSRASSSQMNGHMRKISYWPQRLLDQELQAFSK